MTAHEIVIAVLLALVLSVFVPLFLAGHATRYPAPRPPPYAFEIWPDKGEAR